MPQRITGFSVGQTSKVSGILYGLTALLFVPILLMGSQFAPQGRSLATGFALAMPFIYAGLGFVLGRYRMPAIQLAGGLGRRGRGGVRRRWNIFS